jgi:hypothetical protein
LIKGYSDEPAGEQVFLFPPHFYSALSRNISKFINHQEMESLKLFVQSLKPFFFPALHELSDKETSREIILLLWSLLYFGLR